MKLMGMLFLMTNTLLLSGCSFAPRIGPQTETRTVYVDRTDSSGRPVKIGRVAKNVKVPIELETDKGEVIEDTLDIGGWQVSPPVKVEAVPLK